jgi:FkbM family methyltransferase
MKKIIYDLGSNNGNNIPYYLLKSDLVVAVEANPELCEIIKKNFKKDIDNGKLIVENCIVTVLSDNEDRDFYLHRHYHVLSQFLTPQKSILDQYLKVKLPSRNIISIIKDYGEPYYIKIDLEHYDSYILKELLLRNIYPKYLSIESHSREIIDIIISNGKYKSLKLIDGSQVPKRYKNRIINNINYSFPAHSAGPFGDDIDGQWLEEKNFLFLLSVVGFGWKDIHCSLEDKPSKYYLPAQIIFYSNKKLIRRIIKIIFFFIVIYFVSIFFFNLTQTTF